MNLLQRFLNLVRWPPQHSRVYIGRRQAGVIVDPDTAQTFSAMGACVRILSETMAGLPWPIFRRMATGREPLPTHPANWLLNYQANPEQTAFVFKRQLLNHYLLWGNGYAEIERGLDGRPLWLWPLLPDRTCIERSDTGALVCKARGPDGKAYVLPRENVFHLSDGSFDGIMGVSRVELGRRSIGVGIAQDKFAASYFENGASLGGVITQKTGKTLTAEAKAQMLKEFNETYVGPDRGGKTLYVDAGMEYEAIPPNDMHFVEQHHLSVEEICRWYGVPQHLVQLLQETNYAISYTADKNFVEHTLRPIACLMEQEANIRMIGERARSAVYSRMNLNGLMRADPKARGEYYRALINAGVMSINEVRELEELNSIGPDGDEHYLQVNMTTLSRIASGESLSSGKTEQQQQDNPKPGSEPNAQAPDNPQTDTPGNVIRREALSWWKEQHRA